MLVTRHTIDPDLYQHAERTFGEKGVADMIQLIGLYLSTSALLNAFNIPAPTASSTGINT